MTAMLRATVFLGCAIAVGTPALGTDDPPPQRPAIVKILGAAGAIAQGGVTGRTAAVLFDLATGEVLDSVDADVLLPPASAVKLVTIARALEVLGPRFSFETRLRTDGAIEGDVLQGNLYLQGTGDPTLDTQDLAELQQVLHRLGISWIEGAFYFDDSALPSGDRIDPTQKDHVTANPGFGALNLNFNRVWLDSTSVKSGGAPQLIARADDRSVPSNWVRMEIATDGRFPLLQHRHETAGEVWRVDPRTLTAVPGRWLPVRNPAHYTADAFRTLAAEAGIFLPEPERGVAPISSTVLARHHSPTLARLAAEILYFSNNLAAEIVGLATVVGSGRTPQTLADAAQDLNRRLEKHDDTGWVAIQNHSGLTVDSRVTASGLARLLRQWVQPSAQRGDIRTYLRIDQAEVAPDGGNGLLIHAKTGTMHFVRALMGYLRPFGTGRETGFVILSADLARRAAVIDYLDSPVPALRPRSPTEWHLRALRLHDRILFNWHHGFLSLPSPGAPPPRPEDAGRITTDL